jgi:hypothetical protein
MAVCLYRLLEQNVPGTMVDRPLSGETPDLWLGE